MSPLLLENARDAARAQLDMIHTAVEAFRDALPADAWARVHVVVVGPHMARAGYLHLQYFERLFGEREGERIVYAEGLWKEDGALDLLGTHLVDAPLGADFFGDRRRMHRDLLADAAAEYVPVLLPEPLPKGPEAAEAR